MSTRHTKFNKLWLGYDKYKEWLLEDGFNDRNAKCKLCLCTIQLSNMGKRSLDNHMETKKHKESLKLKKTSQMSSITMNSWLQASKTSSSGTASSSGASLILPSKTAENGT